MIDAAATHHSIVHTIRPELRVSSFSTLHGEVKNQELLKHTGEIAQNSLNNRSLPNMRLYGLKNCDSCRKALKSLPDAELIDVRSQGVPAPVLEQALEVFGEALLNTRSTTWRGLAEDQRDRAPLELLKENPTLMKRPLIDKDGTLFLGWTAETQSGLGVT